MDPLSAVGFVASVVQIATTSLNTLQKLEHVRQKYQHASATINSLCAESEMVRTSLLQLDKLSKDKSNTISAAILTNPDLSAALGRTLKGCNAVYTRLNEELTKIASASQNGNGSRLDFRGKGKFILKERVLEDYLSQIRGHQTALTLFLQMHSLNDISSLVSMLTLLLNTLREQMPTMQRTYSFDTLSEADTLVSPPRRMDTSSLFDDVQEDLKKDHGKLSLGESSNKSMASLGESLSNRGSVSDQSPLKPVQDPFSRDSGPGTSPTAPPAAESISEPEYPRSPVSSSPGIMRNPFRRPVDNRESVEESEASNRDSVDTSKMLVDESEAERYRQFSVQTFRTISSRGEIPSVILEDPGPTAIVHDPSSAGKIAITDDISSSMKILVIPDGAEVVASSSRSPVSPFSITDPRRESDQTIGSRASIATTISSLPETVAGVSVFPKPGRASHALPPDIESTRESLESRRKEVMRSTDVAQQLKWAEEALHFVRTDRKHALKSKSKAKADIDGTNCVHTADADQLLENDAHNVVEALSHQGNANALFIKARWFSFEGDEQRNFYLKALSKGHLRAAYYVGKWHEAEKNKKDALGYYRQGSDGGDAASSHRLAEATLMGELDQKKDHKHAIQLLRYAAAKADGDYPEPLCRLAELQTKDYRKTFKIKTSILPIEEHSARENYLKAAALGHPKAQLTVGIAYARRQLGFPLDPSLSLHYLRLASRQGEAEADYEISNWFWWGQPGVMDPHPEMAFKYARRAAEEAFVPAFVQLGYFYETGFGTKEDKEKAKNCYLQGASLGDVTARRRLDALISGLRIGR